MKRTNDKVLNDIKYSIETGHIWVAHTEDSDKRQKINKNENIGLISLRFESLYTCFDDLCLTQKMKEFNKFTDEFVFTGNNRDEIMTVLKELENENDEIFIIKDINGKIIDLRKKINEIRNERTEYLKKHAEIKNSNNPNKHELLKNLIDNYENRDRSKQEKCFE